MPYQRDDQQNWLKTVGGLGAALLARKVIQQARMTDLRGQIVFITGGSRGLGFLLARKFANAGCLIAICARDEDELERAREDLERSGTYVFTIPCDVTDQQQVEQAVNAVTQHFGRIDILVNVAGMIQVGPLQTMTIQDFHNAMNVMYWGVVQQQVDSPPQRALTGLGLSAAERYHQHPGPDVTTGGHPAYSRRE